MSSILNLDELLGASLDAVEAAPDFITPENGVYILIVKDTKAEKKEVKDKEKARKDNKPTEYVALKFTYTIDEVLEQEGTPIRPGSLFSEQFTLTEQGLPYFKARVAAIAMANGADAEAVNSLSVREALECVKTMAFKTTVKQSQRTHEGRALVDVRLNSIRPVDEE